MGLQDRDIVVVGSSSLVADRNYEVQEVNGVENISTSDSIIGGGENSKV